MKGYFVDEQTDLVQESYAVVYAPKRRRTRFPENVVEVCADKALALAAANPEENRFVARVVGPCRSSEGFNVFYLKEWISETS